MDHTPSTVLEPYEFRSQAVIHTITGRNWIWERVRGTRPARHENIQGSRFTMQMSLLQKWAGLCIVTDTKARGFISQGSN